METGNKIEGRERTDERGEDSRREIVFPPEEVFFFDLIHSHFEGG